MGLVWVFTPIVLIFLGSQTYWLWRVGAWLGRRARTRRAAIAMRAAWLAVYLGFFLWNFEWFGRRNTPTHLTLGEAFFGAPFQWWVASSMVAFLVVLLIWIARGFWRAGRWSARLLPARRADPPAVDAGLSPARRQFLERTVTAAVAAPFVAGAYGLFYGRLNLQTTERPIRLARLPKAFHGFRIVQLSDVHVGPFMSESEIRKYVAIANSLRPDLIVLTGDFITWDPTTQEAAVRSLSGCKAPFGVYGCLGNHEMWSHTEDSITLLFEQVGFRILRQARTAIRSHGEELNLIGVDYQYVRRRRPELPERPPALSAIEGLVAVDRVNVLLSHNPDTFDRAAELGIDLSLAGHTHGGQVALEFISPELAPSRMVTPYVSGWFELPGSQLYVNRGLGTIGVPIRVGAPPEITAYDLIRQA